MIDIRESMRAFLGKERRMSRRLGAVTFVRRYAERGRPVTNYRLSGPSVEAVPEFLESAGLRKGEDFTVLVSSSDKYTAKVVWPETGGRGPEFVEGCLAQNGDGNGFDPCLEAYAAIVSGSTDEEILSRFRECRTENGTAGAAVAETATGFASRIAARSAEIMGKLKECFESGERDPDEYDNGILRLANAFSLQEKIPFVLPLAVIEWYVRRNYGGPWFSLEPLFLGRNVNDHSMKTLARPVKSGETVPLGGLLEAPLFMLTGNAGDADPLRGYVTDDPSEIPAGESDAVLAFVNSPIAAHSAESGEFLVNKRPAFWNYVKGLYAIAYRTKATLTYGSRIGVPMENLPSDEFGVMREDSDTSRGHDSRYNPLLGPLAMFGVLLSDTSEFDDAWIRNLRPAGIKFVKPDDCGEYFRDRRMSETDAAAEWFALTHTMDESGFDSHLFNHRDRSVVDEDAGIADRELNVPGAREFIRLMDGDELLLSYRIARTAADGNAVYASPMSAFLRSVCDELLNVIDPDVPSERCAVVNGVFSAAFDQTADFVPGDDVAPMLKWFDSDPRSERQKLLIGTYEGPGRVMDSLALVVRTSLPATVMKRFASPGDAEKFLLGMKRLLLHNLTLGKTVRIGNVAIGSRVTDNFGLSSTIAREYALDGCLESTSEMRLSCCSGNRLTDIDGNEAEDLVKSWAGPDADGNLCLCFRMPRSVASATLANWRLRRYLPAALSEWVEIATGGYVRSHNSATTDVTGRMLGEAMKRFDIKYVDPTRLPGSPGMITRLVRPRTMFNVGYLHNPPKAWFNSLLDWRITIP